MSEQMPERIWWDSAKGYMHVSHDGYTEYVRADLYKELRITVDALNSELLILQSERRQ